MKEIIKEEWNTYNRRKRDEMNGTILQGRNGKHTRKKNRGKNNVVEARKYDGSNRKKMEWERR